MDRKASAKYSDLCLRTNLPKLNSNYFYYNLEKVRKTVIKFYVAMPEKNLPTNFDFKARSKPSNFTSVIEAK